MENISTAHRIMNQRINGQTYRRTDGTTSSQTDQMLPTNRIKENDEQKKLQNKQTDKEPNAPRRKQKHDQVVNKKDTEQSTNKRRNDQRR